MKKGLLSLLALLSIYTAGAQVAVDTTGVIGDSYNKWSIEVSVGQGKGVDPTKTVIFRVTLKNSSAEYKLIVLVSQVVI